MRTSDSAQRVDAERLEIRWPNGATEVVADLPANHVITLREGERRRWPRAVPPSLKLRRTGPALSAGVALLRVLLILALLAVPSTALAQRDPFFSAVVTFYRSLAGLYGDEGPQLTTQLAAMSTALDRWNSEIGDTERELRSRLPSADAPRRNCRSTRLLASLYLERGRLSDALREFDEDISIDPRRAAFHRLKGLVLQAMSRPADAAEAFRAAWLLDAGGSAECVSIDRASVGSGPRRGDRDARLAPWRPSKRGLIRGERAGAPAPFPNLGGIIDDASGAIAFVPAAYANGFAFILQGELDRGVAALRAALATDPLVTDAASRSEPMARGIAALREGRVTAAIEQLEAAVAGGSDSSEARRILATAYSITGDVARSVQHLREAVRRNPRDERSWLALARTLDETGRSAEARDELRAAVAERTRRRRAALAIIDDTRKTPAG